MPSIAAPVTEPNTNTARSNAETFSHILFRSFILLPPAVFPSLIDHSGQDILGRYTAFFLRRYRTRADRTRPSRGEAYRVLRLSDRASISLARQGRQPKQPGRD